MPKSKRVKENNRYSPTKRVSQKEAKLQPGYQSMTEDISVFAKFLKGNGSLDFLSDLIRSETGKDFTFDDNLKTEFIKVLSGKQFKHFSDAGILTSSMGLPQIDNDKNYQNYKHIKDRFIEKFRNIGKGNTIQSFLESAKRDFYQITSVYYDIYQETERKNKKEDEAGLTESKSFANGISRSSLDEFVTAITGKHDDEWLPIDIFPFNKIGLEINSGGVKSILGTTKNLGKEVIINLADALYQYTKEYISGIPIVVRMRNFIEMINNVGKGLLNSQIFYLFICLVVGWSTPRFSIQDRKSSHTRGYLLFSSIISTLLILANSPPALIYYGDNDYGIKGLERGKEILLIYSNKGQAGENERNLYEKIIQDEDCKVAINALIINTTYAYHRSMLNPEEVEKNAILLENIPLLEMGRRGRGGPRDVNTPNDSARSKKTKQRRKSKSSKKKSKGKKKKSKRRSKRS